MRTAGNFSAFDAGGGGGGGGGQLTECVFYLFQDLMMILSGPSLTPAVSLLLLYSEPHSICLQCTHSSMYSLR